jgi:DHA2 family methylenomycin A resistance protein-like MFS transporter
MQTTRSSETRDTSRPRRVLAVAAMCTGMFFVLLDVTIVNVALPAIRSHLHAGASGQLWVVDADTLVFACLMLPAGALGDRLGPRRLALAGLAVFGAGSLACALSTSVGALVAGRVVQGIGGALLLPQTLAVIAGLYPGRAAQTRVLGFWAGASSLSLPAGPFLGGILVEKLGWPAIFAVNVPVCIVAGVVAALTVPRDRPSAERRPVDWLGATLVTVGLAAAVWACIETGRVPAAEVLPAAALAIASLGAFAVHTRRRTDSLLPKRLLAHRTFSAANAVGLLMNFGGTAVLFLLTLLIQVAGRRSALATAVWLVPATAPLALLPPFAGRIAARTGHRLPMVAGMGIAALGMATLVTANAHSMTATVVASLLIGVGLALNTAPMVAAVMGAVPAEEHALAGAVNNTARQVGAAIGVAALGTIAGDPEHASFVTGLHHAAVFGTIAWLAAALIAHFFVEAGRHEQPGDRDLAEVRA